MRNEGFCLKVKVVGKDRYGENSSPFIPLLRFLTQIPFEFLVCALI